MIGAHFEKDNDHCIRLTWRKSDVCYLTIEEAERFYNELDDVVEYAKAHQPPMFKAGECIIYNGGGDFICRSHQIKYLDIIKKCYITEDGRRIPFAEQYYYEKTSIPPEPKKVVLPDDEQIKEVIRALKNYSEINMGWKRDLDNTVERVKDFYGKPDVFPTASNVD